MNDQVTREETAEILRLAEQALTNTTEGDFVELGCYRGDTSVLLGKLLQKHAPATTNAVTNNTAVTSNTVATPVPPVENSTTTCGKPVQNLNHTVENSAPATPSSPRRLWIYDSFAGLPEKTREDSSGAGAHFQAGELAVTKREVIDKLRRHALKNVIVKKAWFSDLTPADLPEQIAFAFCDGDLYSSIKTSLHLVLPRLVKQGTILVHDYNNPELPGSARAVDEFLRAHPDFTLKVHYTLAILTKKC